MRHPRAVLVLVPMLVQMFVLALVAPAVAQERPATIPQRDVDVTYRMVQPVQGGAPLSQRMRWSVAAGKLRVDPPSPGLYMIVDYRTHRMTVVRPAERAALDMEAAASAIPGTASSSFTRLNANQVAGQTCTDWQTRDSNGQTVVVCITGDGVMLRASAAGTVLLEASSVSYAAQDAATFETPDGYRHVKPGDP